MANDNQLNIEVTASVNGLKAGLQQSENAIKNFSSEADKMAAKTNQLGGAVKANAVPALTSFSQVIQDAPYGIRGVANNITQLTSQLGYLSASTGGAKNAIKAMVSSLIGPAGILLAVSLVTSLLVSYGDEIKGFIFGTNEAKTATERLNDALREQLDLRKLLKDELSVATEIAVAEAKLAGKSAAEQYKIRKQFSEANIQILEKQLQDSKEIGRKISNENFKAAQRGNEEAIQAIADSKKHITDLQKQINDAKSKLYLDDLNEQIRIQEASARESNKAGKKSAVSFMSGFKSGIQGAQKFNFTPENFINVAAFQEAGSKISSALNMKPIVGIDIDSFKEGLTATEIALNEFNKNADSIISGGIANTFMNFGYSIGEALATGGNVLESAGAALLGALGGILVQMGEMAITIGVSLIGIKKALQSLNPAVAIAAGIALIALGAFFSAKSKSIGGSIGGGGGDFSSKGSRANYGSSTGNFSGGGGAGGTYVFEIAGTKLIGVLKNTLDRNKALGGTNLVFG